MPLKSRPLELAPHSYPGIFIAFCGIDGSGKTSMIEAAADYLEHRGLSCLKTYTPTARIRKNTLFRELVDTADANSRASVDVLGMSLQILGDLLQHIKDTIVPHLMQGNVVLCDRYVYSSLGEIRTRTKDREIEDILAKIARRMLRPDLAIAMDVPSELAIYRIHQRDDERHKLLDSEFIALQTRNYLAVARENGLLVVSSDCKPETAFAAIRSRLDQCISEHC